MHLNLDSHRPNGDFTLDGTYVRSDASVLGIDDRAVIGQSILQFLSVDEWQEITHKLKQGGTLRGVPLEFQAPIGRVRELTDWRLKMVGSVPLIYAEATEIKLIDAADPVTSITAIADICTDRHVKIGQNASKKPGVPKSNLIMRSLIVEDRKEAFLKAVYSVAGDLIEPNYLVLPQMGCNLELEFVFVCKGVFAQNAPEAYDRIRSLDFPLVHFYLFCQEEAKKERLVPAFCLYGHQALSSKLKNSSLRSSIMSNQIQDAAINRKWAGVSNYLQDPKALRYWEYILNDRPLVASAYIYSADDRNEIVSVGAKRTFGQLNLKEKSGQPAILHQTVSAFDDQIRPYRTAALAEVKQNGAVDVPITFTREYYDEAIGMEFAFIEEMFLLSTGEKLNICSYRTEDLDRYWQKQVEAKQKYR
jgi:hypothetical protein